MYKEFEKARKGRRWIFQLGEDRKCYILALHCDITESVPQNCVESTACQCKTGYNTSLENGFDQMCKKCKTDQSKCAECFGLLKTCTSMHGWVQLISVGYSTSQGCLKGARGTCPMGTRTRGSVDGKQASLCHQLCSVYTYSSI